MTKPGRSKWIVTGVVCLRAAMWIWEEDNHIFAVRASKPLNEGKTDEALSEAQIAVDLMPRSASAQAVWGKALRTIGRTAGARAAYAHALSLAKSIRPGMQAELDEAMAKKLATH